MLKREAVAGTCEKGDAQITVCPIGCERDLRIQRVSHPRFQSEILKLAVRVLDELEISGIRVEIQEFGALDFVLEARLRAAIAMAGGES